MKRFIFIHIFGASLALICQPWAAASNFAANGGSYASDFGTEATTTSCKDTLQDLEKKNFAESFKTAVLAQAKKSNLTPEQLRTALIEEVTGAGENAGKKAYLMTVGEKTWWFYQTRSLLGKHVTSGNFTEQKSIEQLTHYMGDQVVTTSGQHYVFIDRLYPNGTGTKSVKISQPVLTDFENLVATHSDEVFKKVKAYYGRLLLAAAETGDLDLKELTDGNFITVNDDGLSRENELLEVVLFLPHDEEGDLYLFHTRTTDRRKNDTPYFAKFKKLPKTTSHYSGYQLVDIKALTSPDSNELTHTAKPQILDMINDHVLRLSNGTHISSSAASGEPEKNYLYFLNESALAQQKKAIIEAGRLADEYEGGPHLAFVNEYLEQFLKYHIKSVLNFSQLSTFKLIASWRTMGPKPSYAGVFEVGGRQYSFHDGQIAGKTTFSDFTGPAQFVTKNGEPQYKNVLWGRKGVYFPENASLAEIKESLKAKDIESSDTIEYTRLADHYLVPFIETYYNMISDVNDLKDIKVIWSGRSKTNPGLSVLQFSFKNENFVGSLENGHVAFASFEQFERPSGLRFAPISFSKSLGSELVLSDGRILTKLKLSNDFIWREPKPGEALSHVLEQWKKPHQ